ncbi:glycosyltransferase [Sabulicella rubraurantiaca]|uniref:glycosyltransferase n=1 Tax=Sabulicella rubraurantiaca TaxID=2811429 RepID=UPI001A96AA65|nr:glycosyltransferase [Sabulicella rubraurantiaca]
MARKEGASLAEAGWRVRHLAPHCAAPVMLDGVEIETLPPGLGRRSRWGKLLRRALALRPAAIHASEPDSWAVALLAGRMTGARVVLDVHEHYPSRLDGRLPALLRPLGRAALRLVLALMGRMADAVVVAKDGLEADFPGARCVAARNRALVPPGLHPRQHRAGPLTLLHLGAITRARGWPQMLAALALLPPDTRLLVIGRFSDGSEAEFRAEAARLGLADRVEVAPWMQREAALARASSEADVNLVLFQPGEENHRLALPHKLFDGMAAGLPAVVPGFAADVARIARTTGSGIATDPSDRTKRVAMGVAGRRAAEGEWGWAPEAARLAALYRELLAPRARAGRRAAEAAL